MDQSVNLPLTHPIGRVGQQERSRPVGSGVPQAYSIFHEPWWLDCVAPGAWSEVQVAPGDGTTARWPFHLRRRWGLLVSTQPPLTRTLGPVLRLACGTPIQDFRRRLRLTYALINQLPPTQFFEQTFDPRINEAVAFRVHGFSVNSAYTFRIEPTRTADDVWTHMTDKTRNAIRRATEQVHLFPIDDPELFCTFYEANLAAAGRTNLYGTPTMRRLTDAFMARGAGSLLGARMRHAFIEGGC